MSMGMSGGRKPFWSVSMAVVERDNFERVRRAIVSSRPGLLLRVEGSPPPSSSCSRLGSLLLGDSCKSITRGVKASSRICGSGSMSVAMELSSLWKVQVFHLVIPQTESTAYRVLVILIRFVFIVIVVVFVQLLIYQPTDRLIRLDGLQV